MQIPTQLQRFPQLSLVIVTDHYQARFYLVGGSDLQELDGVAEPKPQLTDREGAFAGSDGTRVGEPDIEHVDEARLVHFVKKVLQQTESLIRSHGVTAVYIAMPADVHRPFEERMSSEVRTALGKGKMLHADLMKEAPLDILKRFVDLF